MLRKKRGGGMCLCPNMEIGERSPHSAQQGGKKSH